MSGDALRPVLADMAGALRSEYGARAIYPLLARLARDPELKAVLGALHAEQLELARSQRQLMRDLGADPPAHSLRRSLLAWLLLAATPVLGMRFALRMCGEAEARVARWYHGYAAWFLDRGMGELARRCHAQSTIKRTHAQALEAFIDHARAR